MRLSLCFLVLCVVVAPALTAQPRAERPDGWRAVFKNDAHGRGLVGNRDELIDAVRRGLPVRLAWGVQHPRDSSRSVEHTALPVFLTVVDGREVFVQVAEHVAFADYWARDSQAVADPRVTWVAILGTTGTFNALWYDRGTGKLVRHMPQRVTITWFVEGPAKAQPSPPLFSQRPALPSPSR